MTDPISAQAEKAWPEIVWAIHDHDGEAGFKLLVAALTTAIARERALAKEMVEALERIAKPALGGKQQQAIARTALARAKEEGLL